MKKLCAAILFLSATGWATYIPVNGSTIVVQGSGGAAITATSGAMDINIKSGSIGNTGFNVNNSPSINQAGTWTVQPGNTQNTTAWIVQTSSGGVNGSTIAVVNANNTKLLVTPDSVALPANQSVNVNQFGGSNAVTGTGSGGAGIPRVTISNDSSLAANQSVNVNQFGGSNIVTGTGASGAGIPRVTVSNDSSISGNPLSLTATVTPGTGTWSVSATPLAATVTVTPGTGTWTIAGNLSNNGATQGANRVGILPAIYSTYTITGTTNKDAALQVGAKDGSLHMTEGQNTSVPSYYASTNTFSTAATATYLFGVCGNAVTNIKVDTIGLSCTQTTAGMITVAAKKLSTTYAGAWSTMTATPSDSNFTIPFSTAVYFTANPTPGTEVGHITDMQVGCMAAGTASPNDLFITPSFLKTDPIVLRGVSQCVVVDLLGTTVTGGKITPFIHWREDSGT